MTLADSARRLDLTGTIWLRARVCGACTVLVDDESGARLHHARRCSGRREVRTIEGFEEDRVMEVIASAFSRRTGCVRY